MTTVTHSYPLSLPTTPAPRSSVVRLRRAVAYSQSGFSFVGQAQKHPGAQWVVEFEYPPMNRAQAAAWQAFFLKLQGRYGTFYAGDPDAKTPRGTISGTVLVNGASQTGNQVNLKNGAGTLLEGDYIQIGDYMYAVVEDVSFASDGASPATSIASVKIEPSLRSSPSDGASVTCQNCVTKMRLIDSEAAWSADALSIYGLSLRGIEALPTS